METVKPEAESRRVLISDFLADIFEEARAKRALDYDTLAYFKSTEYGIIEPNGLDNYSFYIINPFRGESLERSTSQSPKEGIRPVFEITEYLKIGDDNLPVSVIPFAKVGKVCQYGVYDDGRIFSTNTNKILNKTEQVVFERQVSECELVDSIPSWLSRLNQE